MYAHQAIIALQELQKTKLPIWSFPRKSLNAFENTIKVCPKFNINNFDEWLYQTKLNRNISNRNKFIDKHFEYLKLPYEICWIDCKFKFQFIKNKKIEIKSRNNDIEKIGILVFNGAKEHKKSLTFIMLFNYKGENNWMLLNNFYCVLSYIYKDIWYAFSNRGYPEPIQKCEQEGICLQLGGLLLVYTLLFLNCQNIKIKEISISKSINKKRMSINKIPFFSYKILKLKQSNIQNKYIDIQKKERNKNRIHLCRGHFKKTKTGLYWWQPHVRGRNKQGIIMKDYKI